MIQLSFLPGDSGSQSILDPKEEKKMKRKGILKKSLLLLLAIITVLSCSVMVFAAGWNGDGATGGSASSTAHGAYAILRGQTAESMIVGFRLSGRFNDE